MRDAALGSDDRVVSDFAVTDHANLSRQNCALANFR